MDENKLDKPTSKAKSEDSELSTAKVEHPKKSKKLIAAVIAACLLIVGGIVWAVASISASNTPEGIVLDAVTSTIKEREHTFDGTLVFAFPSTSSSGKYTETRLVLTFNSTNSGMNNSGSATVAIENNEYAGDYIFRFDEVLQDDGIFYLKTTELNDFVNSLASISGPYLKTAPFSGIISEVKNLSKKIDSTWWRISVPEIVNAFGVRDQQYLSSYECAIKAAKGLFEQSNLNTVSTLYKDHQFLKPKVSSYRADSFTGDSYEVTVDSQRFVDFWNRYVTSSAVTSIKVCLPENDENSQKVFNPINAETIEPLAGQTFYLDIDKNHNLSGIYVNMNKGNFSTVFDLRIKDGAGEIIVPSDSKPISDLTSDIMRLFSMISGVVTQLSE